jgi:hypothetical protein
MPNHQKGSGSFGEEKKTYFLSLEPKDIFAVVRSRVYHFTDYDVLIQFEVLYQIMAGGIAGNNDRFAGREFKHATSRIPSRGDILPD